MALTLRSQRNNPRAELFVPTATEKKWLQERRGKREEGEATDSKHQSARARKMEWPRQGGKAEPNLPDEKFRAKTGTRNGDVILHIEEKEKGAKIVRKRRRRGRLERRDTRRKASSNRERALRQELVIATRNVRTMAMDGNMALDV